MGCSSNAIQSLPVASICGWYRRDPTIGLRWTIAVAQIHQFDSAWFEREWFTCNVDVSTMGPIYWPWFNINTPAQVWSIQLFFGSFETFARLKKMCDFLLILDLLMVLYRNVVAFPNCTRPAPPSKFRQTIHGWHHSVFDVWNFCDQHRPRGAIVCYRGENKRTKWLHFWMHRPFIRVANEVLNDLAYSRMVCYCMAVEHREMMCACAALLPINAYDLVIYEVANSPDCWQCIMFGCWSTIESLANWPKWICIGAMKRYSKKRGASLAQWCSI